MAFLPDWNHCASELQYRVALQPWTPGPSIKARRTLSEASSMPYKCTVYLEAEGRFKFAGRKPRPPRHGSIELIQVPIVVVGSERSEGTGRQPCERVSDQVPELIRYDSAVSTCKEYQRFKAPFQPCSLPLTAPSRLGHDGEGRVQHNCFLAHKSRH